MIDVLSFNAWLLGGDLLATLWLDCVVHVGERLVGKSGT